ncbi:MAG: CheR family methyltransferase [Microthrixaceae bacterium]
MSSASLSTSSRPAVPPTTGSGSSLGATDLDFVRELVLARSAIVLDAGKGYLVESRLAPIVREEGLSSIGELVDQLRRRPRSPLEARAVDAMTTNETSFFRDVHPFEALPAIIADLPGGATGPLTIWCAACSSGQEPYSIAMKIHEQLPHLASRVRILGTDLSPTMVERCRAGRFSQLEVNRGLPARLLVRYFDQDGTDWVAKPQLRSMIDARVGNLAEPLLGTPRCHLVMIRNVLIYFSVQTKTEILGRIRKDVLVPGGLLMLGSSETTHNIDNAYERVEYGRATCYRPAAN